MPSPTSPSPWQRLYNDIKISVPGVTDAVLQQELFRCAKDFFEQTNIWQEEIPIPVQPQVLSYPFTIAGKGSIKRLLLLYDPATASPDRRWVQGGITLKLPSTIMLANSPSSATNWIAVVTKTITDPVDATTNYPEIDPTYEWVLDNYRDAFYYGTLARIQMQPNKPYSNLKSAAYNNQNYIVLRGRARAEALHGNVYGGQRWMFPQTHATTSRKGWN